MFLIRLDIRCLCILLICMTFDAVLSSNAEIKVNPPQDFEIVDPGYLGYLYLLWKPPLFADNFKDCTVEYELKYRNIDSASWKTIITKNLHYKDGFDLNKGIEAKILTLLPEQCTNGSMVKSSWSEATYWASNKGHVNTKIKYLECVYSNWQHLFCFWEPGIGAKFDGTYSLFYWYDGLDHAMQCPNYIKEGRKNIGCRFPHLESSDYKDFYICVNGTSQFKFIRSRYFIFQLQNIVKPLPPEYLSLTVKNSEDIFLRWNVPRGPIPSKCFIYETQFIEDDSISFWTTTFENEIIVTKSLNESRKVCFSVRSKVNIYCADDGIWSDWSEEQCWKGYVFKETVILFLLPLAFVLFFVLSASCLLISKQKALLKVTFCEK